MFLDDFCNDSQGWGPINEQNNDLTSCAQSWLIFAPINFTFISLCMYYIISLLRMKSRMDNAYLQSYHMIEKAEKAQSLGDICNMDFILSIIFTLSISYALVATIMVSELETKDKLNWTIFDLSWELLSWIIFTFLLFLERRYVYLYGIGEAPSPLVRWCWVIQFVLALKNLQSVLFAKYINHTQHVNEVFYIRIFLVLPFFMLCIRAITLRAQQTEQEIITDNGPISTKKYAKTLEETSSLFDILTFGWLSSLFVTGYKRALQMDDFKYLKGIDHSHETLKLFYKSWRLQLQKATRKNGPKHSHSASASAVQSMGAAYKIEPLIHEKWRSKPDKNSFGLQARIEENAKYQPSLTRALLGSFGRPFYVAGILKIIYDCLQYTGPVILAAYLSDAELFDNDSQNAQKEAYLYAALMFVTYMCGTLILAQYFHRCFRFGMRVRCALMAACYDKALKLTQGARSERTAGQLLNIVTVDVRKIRDVFPYTWMLISAPWQITLAVYLLYQQIGWAVFVGIAANVAVITPIQIAVGIKARKIQKEVQKVRDKRIKVINEVFGAMKIVKMYGWETSFGRKIASIRSEELKLLRCYIWIYTVMVLFWGFAANLVSLAAFAAYTANGGELNATKAFTSVALFSLLRFPLSILPRIILSFIEANVSLGRIRTFLCSNEIDPNIIEHAKIDINVNDEAVPVEEEQKHANNTSSVIALQHAEFSWDDKGHHIALYNISTTFQLNTITMVVGQTGSGKSALLRGILGNLTKIRGHIIYDNSSKQGERIKIAYSSQVAWIQNATVRDNILFGSAYNKKMYDKAITSCALVSDLKILPAGDKTEIGEKGINLSGGQKQRISLARAVYSNADVYVFDDPLSAVDSHVANHIFNQCFVDLLKNQKKTIILATHSVSFLKYADNILVMEDGTISLQGQLQDLIDAKINLTNFIIHKDEESDGDEHGDEDPDEKADGSPLLSNISDKDKNKDNDADKKQTGDGVAGAALIKEEERAVGNVSFGVYFLYVRAAGGILFFLLYVLLLSLYAGSNTMAIFWLAFWSDDKFSNKDKSQMWYLSMYSIIQMGALFSLFTAAIIALITRLKASKYLHESLLSKVLRAPMSFFDTTPIGRIINRFSRDMYSVDQTIPGSYQTALRITIGLVATAFGVCIVTPYFALSLIPLSVVYYYLQNYFITTSRELRRLSTLQNSPIYSNFSESVSGVDIIKSFGKIEEFSKKNKTLIDCDHNAYYPSIAANRWLAIRLETIGNCLIGSAALFCAITQPPVGYIGVALSTMMSVTQGLNWFVRQKAELEQDIVGVERINQYSHKDTVEEKADIIRSSRPSKRWPMNGAISFSNVYMKYRPELQYVLKGLTFDIKGGEKVGVIGRTGAGKSSLFVTLLRIVEIETDLYSINDSESNNMIKFNLNKNNKCQILIDNVDIASIGLYDLRSKVSVIPQDPILFTGTVRFNLDPFQERSDVELIEALKLAHCYDALKKMIIEITIKKEKDIQEENKHNEEASVSFDVAQFMDIHPKYRDLNPLDIYVEEDGSNFSVGQRQLLCLSRAIVRKSKILLLDEPTSAVDPSTDQLLQETIRNVFKTNTILTIAHRIDTILDYDRILIMDNGKVLEFDSPESLLSNQRSRFSAIVQASFGVNLQDVIKNRSYMKKQ